MNRGKGVGPPAFSEDQRGHFDDLITREWHTYISASWDASRAFEVRRLLGLLPRAPRRVLNVGCGCGFHDRLFAEHDGVEEVLGVDYSARSVARAREAYPHRKVERRVADIFSGELEGAGPFDLVTSFQVIEHLARAGEFLTACARLAGDGGWVAAATPNRDRLENRLRRLAGRPDVLCDAQHFREYSLAELRALASDAGLVFRGAFGHDMSLKLPGTGRDLMPHFVGLRLGYLLPSAANVIVAVFRKGGAR